MQPSVAGLPSYHAALAAALIAKGLEHRWRLKPTLPVLIV